MIDYDDIFKKKFDYRILVVIFLAIIVGVYIVNLMFGKHSFSRMLDLDNSVKILKKRVQKLKQENAKLQKEYFELKELEGE